VESILLPSQQISPLFRATVIVTKDQAVLSGLVVKESDPALELLLPDTTRRTVMLGDIAERRVQETSPMPAGLVKEPQELLDLLAFILSE